MANQKLTALTEDSAPDGSDLGYVVKSATNSRKRYLPDFNLLPDGWATNYEISVTVATSDLTVALKTKSGGNPSATDPVGAWINGTYRRGTASLSVTKNDGTNWFGSGSSEKATLTVPYFVYLIWNTTPATDILDIGFSPIPYGRVYSDFSATTTAQNYLAHANASDPAATDDCVCIGRFEATLSATAAFTWSVPTFTGANLIQRPIDYSEWHTWTPTLVGFSANPTNTIYEYMLDKKMCIARARQATNGTSNATNFTLTAPFTAKTVTNGVWSLSLNVIDNGTAQANPGLVSISSGTSTIAIAKDLSGGTFTAAAGKRFGYFELRYPLA
jgi:hypothetical protein